VRELNLYVSASAEMDAECELLGQLLAQLTQTVRWAIKRTPPPHLKIDADWAALDRADFYVILIGSDITAPIGVEWRAAQDKGVPTLAYRNALATPSPALSGFVRQARANWHPYESAQTFAADFRRRLCELLIDGTPGYGLSLEEIETLAKALHDEDREPNADGEERRGAGSGGVILPRGQDLR